MAVDLFKAIPTTTAGQSRLQVYQPTRRPTWMVRTIETSWGWAKITGKTGQNHADLMEAICKLAIDHRITDTGQIQILVDPYLVRKLIGGGKLYSYSSTWQMIEDLRLTSIDLTLKNFDERILGGVIDMVRESTMTVTASRSGKPRHLWQVTLNPAYSALLGGDLPLYYDPAPLVLIPSGVAQAIARHILTHKEQPNGGWILDNLLERVGAGGQYLRKRRSEVHRDREQLLDAGIFLDGDRLFKGPRTP